MGVQVNIDGNDVGEILINTFIEHKDLLLGIIIGIFLIIIYNKFIGLYALKKSYERVIKEKDDHIDSLKTIVYERLEAVTSDTLEPKLFRNIKRYFKRGKK